MPPKTSKEPRRRSIRLQVQEDEKKRLNLKEILQRGSSNLDKRRTEQSNGDFIFKRSDSRDSSNVSRSSVSSKSQQKSQPLKKGKMRRLQAEDMMITPDQQHKKQKSKQISSAITNQQDGYEEHSTSFQVSLPVSDTPIIRRNKELRSNNQNGRRTSLSNRGKRVSSIGNGFTAVPHDQVPSSEYYKHLDDSLPDPHKMRQLLTWCSKRVFEEDKNRHIKQKNKLPSEELTALNIAKVIKEEIVNDLTSGKINISWWNRDDEDEGDDDKDLEGTGGKNGHGGRGGEIKQKRDSSQLEKTLLPNERNVKNSEVLEQLKLRLADLKSSSDEWEKNMSKYVELPPITMDGVHLDNNGEVQKVMDQSQLKQMVQLEESTYNEISQNLELSMDSLSEFVHHLKSASNVRQKFATIESEKLSNVLDSTFDDSTLHKINHSDLNKDLDTQQLLRGISRLDR